MTQTFTGKPLRLSILKTFHPESFLFLLPLLTIMVGWEAALRLQLVSAKILPSPFNVFQTLILNITNVSFLMLAAKSLTILTLGLASAFLLAVPLAIGTGLRHHLDSAFTPLIMIFGALPDLALLPIIIYWFGANAASALLMAVIVAFFPIFFMVREGVGSIPADYFHAVEIYSTRRHQVFTKLIFPATFPHMLTGLRLSYEFLWEVILATEIIAQISGVGFFIDASVKGGALNEGFAALFFIGIIAIIVDRALFQRLENRIKRWRE
jgi:NitT/TauT family transport system permease protein